MSNAESHQLRHILNAVRSAIVVVDKELRIQRWNRQISTYTDISADHAVGNPLFDVLQPIQEGFIRRKLHTTFSLNTSTFSRWQQRPHVFKMSPGRKVTSAEELMYQDVTFTPIGHSESGIALACIAIEDLTDTVMYQKQLTETVEKLKRLSQVDHLTQIYNRGHWEYRLREELLRASRYGRELSLLMIDIDYFKMLNDTYGHLCGDEVLRQFSNMIKKPSRNSDILGRYGGEEFASILTETGAEGARMAAERMLECIRTGKIHSDKNLLTVTASIGVTSIHGGQCKSADRLINVADKALYYAKESGRNCYRYLEFPT